MGTKPFSSLGWDRILVSVIPDRPNGDANSLGSMLLQPLQQEGGVDATRIGYDKGADPQPPHLL